MYPSNKVQTALRLLPLIACVRADYTANAEAAFAVLQQWYNTTSGLWDTCGWWNGANCMTVIADLAAVDSNVLASATSVFATTFTQAPAVNPNTEVTKVATSQNIYTFYGPDSKDVAAGHSLEGRDGNSAGFIDTCYDDNGWWALAWIAAYDLTQNQDYLDTASGIFDEMTGGWPSNCSNGGIYWCSTSTYVNAIANELFLSVAAHLANRITSNSTYYINWAQEEWSWFQSSGLINSNNTINDGLTDSCGNNGETVWSYNQGVILGGLVELNKAAPNASLLTTAGTIAQAAIANLTDSNQIIHEACEPDCAPDGTQFKGIFMRNLAMLQQAAPNDLYVQVIQANADSIWANDNENNELSIDWAGPFDDPANASTQSSAMDALIAAIVVS